MEPVSAGMQGSRRLVVLVALLCALLGGAAGEALGAAGPTSLGPRPPDCGAAKRDYADPSCTTQTRNGTFALDSNKVRAGGTLSGEVSSRCLKHPDGDFAKPATQPCPIVWDHLLELGSKVAGCTPEAASCTVRIPKGAASSGYRTVAVGITSDQGTGISKDYFAIVGGDLFELGGHIVGRDGKPLGQAVTVHIAGPQSTTVTADGSTGRYSELLKKGTYTVSAARVQLKPVATTDCVAVADACKVTLTQDRTADFELPGAPLLLEASLGPFVHGPTRHSAARAGTAIVVKVTLRNTSRTNRIVIPGETLWPKLAGNAFDGHLQAATAPVYDLGKAAGDAQLSPDVVLQPKQTREFAFVVRTRSLNTAWYAAEQQKAPSVGNTTQPARIEIVAPRVGVLPKGSRVSVAKKEIEWLDGAAGTELKGTTTYTVPIDDSDPEAPPWDGKAFAGELVYGVLPAIASWTVGTIRGIVWDLPNAAAAWGFGALYATDELTELSQALASAPAGGEAYLRYAKAVNDRIEQEHAEAQFLADHSPGYLQRIEAELRQHWTQVAEEYYSGDWHKAAATISEETTHGVLNVVTLVAPGALARVPGIKQLLGAWRARQLAQSAAQARAAVLALEGVTAAELGRSAVLLQKVKAALAAVKALLPGLPVNRAMLQRLYGFTVDQITAIEEVGRGALTGGRRIVSSWTGRNKFAAAIKDALGKPSWMKPGGVEIADVEFLGESAENLGAQSWTPPPLLDAAERELAAAGKLTGSGKRFVAELRGKLAARGRTLTRSDEAVAVAQWTKRVGEWTSKAPGKIKDLLRRAKEAEANGGRTTVEFEFEGNVQDASIKNEPYDVGYSLESTTTDAAVDPWGPRTRYAPRISEEGGSVLRRVVSDQDPVAFMYANGEPLSVADRMAVYRFLRKQGIISHPDTGSFANQAVRDQILVDGLPTVTLGPDGGWVTSRFSAAKSRYVSPGDFRHVEDGVQLVPLAP